jgi:radical SAM superfamily enzyme YgiQ (UPF0313 family)
MHFVWGKNNTLEFIPYIPLGLLSLAAILEKKEHEVFVVDLNLLINNGKIAYNADFYQNVAEYLKKYNAKVLGFSTVCDAYPYTIQIAQKYKKMDNNTLIILGGPEASAVDIETLRHFPFITLIVRGEGELTFSEVIKKVEAGESYADVLGITYREEGTGRIRRNADRERIEDLDALPFPAYHLYPVSEVIKKVKAGESYADVLGITYREEGTGRIRGNEDEERLEGGLDALPFPVYPVSEFENYNIFLPLDVGRGCPYDCNFCSTTQFWKRKYRLKSTGKIIKEIEFLKEKYSVRYFSIVNDLFTVNKKSVMEFCDAVIERGLDIEWACYGRTDTMDSILLEKMAKAGCIRIFYGIESGSARMQQHIGKNLDLTEVLTVINESTKSGIAVKTSFITGFPEETEEDLRQTIDLFLNVFMWGVTINEIGLLIPLPGTRVYQDNRANLIPDLTYSSGVMEDNIFNRKLVMKHPGIFSNFYSIKPNHLDLKLLRVIVNNVHIYPFSLIAITNEWGDSLKIFKDWDSCKNKISFYMYIRKLISEGKLRTAYLKDLLEYEHSIYLLGMKSFGNIPNANEFEFDKKVRIKENVRIKEFSYNIKNIVNSFRQRYFGAIEEEPSIILFFQKSFMLVKSFCLNTFTKELIEVCTHNKNYTVRDVVNEMSARSYNSEKCVDTLKKLYEIGIIACGG